ncbi:MAG TPA: pitrilysin family protein [Noviherbaspirillum sp.]|nr:pitrilysin family protein [Noviherbaspirillum sp.]
MFRRFLFSCLIGLIAHAPALAALKIEAWTLENGARVLFVENHTIPMLDVSVDFDAGSRRDPQGKPGTALLTQAMLARGLRAEGKEPALTEAQISDTFADTAAQQGGAAGMDRAGVTLRTLADPAERDVSVALLARLLAHPSFPDNFLARDRARLIAAIKEEETKPEAIADKAFRRHAYGDHPYGRSPTAASVQAIARDDLVRFHRTHYVANRAVVAMIGSISRAQADAIARELTRRLPQGAPLPELPQVRIAPGQEHWIAHPASQAHVVIGMPAVARGDPDFFPLMVGNYTLGGGGFVSRLMREVREKRGLAYSAYSYFSPLAQPGPFEAGLQTQREQADNALGVVRETIGAFLRDGPSEQELQAAKDNLIGGFALRIDNNRKILDNIAMIGFYGLPLDYLDTWTERIARVTLADVRAAFGRKLAVEGMTTVVVGGARQ